MTRIIRAMVRAFLSMSSLLLMAFSLRNWRRHAAPVFAFPSSG
jgi:hypothetical protein